MLPFAELRRRAVTVPTLGRAALTPSPVDALFLACIHRVAHHEDAIDLLWLWDIHLLTSRLGDDERATFAALAVRTSMTSGFAPRHCVRRPVVRLARSAELLALLHPGADEPSAKFLGGVRPATVFATDFTSLPTWRARVRLAAEHLFPSRVYMRTRYSAWPPFLVPLADADLDSRRRAKWFCCATLRPAGTSPRAVIPASDRRYAIGANRGGEEVDSTARCAGLPFCSRVSGHRGARDEHCRAPSPLRRRARHSQLRRVRRRWRPRLRHGSGLPVRPQDSYVRGRAGKEPDNVKGIAAHAGTGRLYVSTIKRIAAFDLSTDKVIWNREYEGGCDRLAISPDGKLLYVPSFEGPHWLVVDAKTGNVVAKIVTNSGAHNTIYGPDGHRVYLAGLHSPLLSIADPATHRVVATVGPFGNSIRPFTINAGADALLRERQRAAWIRGRRHPHRQDAASRRGDGLHQGAREAAWLPEPRHRPDARREGAVAGRRRQQQAAHLRRDRDAAQAGGDHQRARSTGLDHVQPRRPACVSLDRRDHRHEDPTCRRDTAGRNRPERCRAKKSSRSCLRATRSCEQAINSASAGSNEVQR